MTSEQRRLDAILRSVIPASYNTRQKRFHRAVAVLNGSGCQLPPGGASEYLKMMAESPVLACLGIGDTIRDALAKAKSAASRKASSAARHRRDPRTGKYLRGK